MTSVNEGMQRVVPDRSSSSQRLVKWNPPEKGWVRLNTDGSCCRSSLLASCGGLIRDENGVWKGGFARKVGSCLILEAELWGLVEGLKLAWSLGFRCVEVEMDSLVAVNLVKDADSNVDVGGGLIQIILGLLRRRWEIMVLHIFREGNRAADCLASFAMRMVENRIVWREQPDCVNLVLFEDYFGPPLAEGF